MPLTRTILLTLLVLVVVNALAFGAGDGGGLELSPPSIDLLVEPGTERTFDIMLGNKSDSGTVKMRASILPVTQIANGQYTLATEAGKWSAGPWLSLKTEAITLKPRDQELVPVKVKLPRGVTGSRTAAVVFDVLPVAGAGPLDSLGGSVSFVHRLTTIVKITAKNRANKLDASIKGLVVIYPLDQRAGNFGPNAVAVVCAVANEGDTILNGQGRLIVRNAEGRRVKEAPLGAGKGVVLPDSTVEFVSIFPEGLPEGKYSAEVTISYGVPRPLQAKTPFEIVRGKTTAGRVEVAKGVRLAIDPSSLETTLPPGAFRGFSLNLYNQEPAPVNVRFTVKGLAMNPEGGFVAAEGTKKEWSAAGWVRLGSQSFTLAPGERKIVPVTVAVPKEAAGGTHYALLFCETARTDGGKNASTTEIGTPIAVNVGKTLIRKAAITKTWLEQPDDNGLFNICADLVNQGNTHLKLSGELVLYRRTDPPKIEGGIEYIGEGRFERIDSIPMPEYSYWILPGATVSISAPYPKLLGPGEYQAELVLEIGEKLPVKGSVRFRVAPKDVGKTQGKAPG